MRDHHPHPHRPILHRIELRRNSDRDKFGFAIQYEQPCSVCVYSGSLAQANGLRSGQILAKVNGYNVLDARHDDVKALVYAKNTNVLVLEVLDRDDDFDEDDDMSHVDGKENRSSSSPCHVTSKATLIDGRILRDINSSSIPQHPPTTTKYVVEHYYKKARESLTSSSQDSMTSTTSDPIPHPSSSLHNLDRRRLSKVLISTNLRMLLSQINDVILLKDMYSSLTPGVNLIDAQSSLSFNHQTLYTFSSIDFLGHFDIDHRNQNEPPRKLQKFLKRIVANSSSPIPIDIRIKCRHFQLVPLWHRPLAGKYLSYVCLFHTQPTLFALVLYCSVTVDRRLKKQHENHSSSMLVFRASSIDERNRLVQCLFTRAKHCSVHPCPSQKSSKKKSQQKQRKTKSIDMQLDEPDTCSTNSSCATSIDSNLDSCTTGTTTTTSQSSVESISPNPLRASIEEEDDEDEDHHQRSIPPPPEFCQDDDLCPVPSGSSSSSSLSDGELLDNQLGAPSTASATTGQFLWIDHHPRRHSFANDSHPLETYTFRYHSSSPFVDDPPLTDELRARFASAYVLTAGPSLSAIHSEDEVPQLEASIDESMNHQSIDHRIVTSWAVSFENLLHDQMGLHVFTEFLKKEFSQENIQFWIACEKFKTLSDTDEIRQKANSIWSTYLHDIDDGSCPINIDSRTRQECHHSLLTKPHVYMFEKAQSQIFQLMKYDSYTRFLKSNMYKDCIVNEMAGKSILVSKQQQQQTSNEERSKTIDCHVKLKEEEKKDKKRSPFLPWTKAFNKWRRPMSSGTVPPSSSDNCSIKSCQISSSNTFSR